MPLFAYMWVVVLEERALLARMKLEVAVVPTGVSELLKQVRIAEGVACAAVDEIEAERAIQVTCNDEVSSQ
jgi:hypothetical protein